MLLPCRLTDS